MSPLAVATTLEKFAVDHNVPVLPVDFTLLLEMKIPFRLPVALMLKSAVVELLIDRLDAASSSHVTRFDSV